MIVDDNPTNLKLLRVLLEAEGVKVLTAADGLEALAVLEREPVDAVISDILMPRMDGYRLCHEVRASPRFFALPFIFYTATYTSLSDEKFSLELGADKFIKKPAPVRDLLEGLEEIMRAPSHSQPKPLASSHELSMMKEYNERLVAKLEQRNEELLLQSTALETAANAIFITDAQGAILWTNPAFTLLTGYAAEEVIGRNPRMLKSGTHDAVFYQELWRTILAGKTWRGEFTNRRKDGTLYYGEQTITPVRSDAGTIHRFIGIMNDVTARKRAEEELRTTHSQLRQLLESTSDGIYGVDLRGNCTFVNRAGAELLGFTAEELLGRELHALIHHHRKDGSPYPAEECPIFCALQRGTGCRVHDEVYWRRDGSFFPVEYSSSPILEAGVLKGAVVNFMDCTEQKRLEAQFLRHQRLDSIGTLAGGIAHDLNNVLAPILISMELFRLRFPDRESLELVDMVTASAQRGAAMVKQILTFARGAEGERAPVQLKYLISDLEKICRDTFPPSIAVRRNVAGDLKSVMGDATQLYQVLLNLCVNARDAMPRGGKLSIEANTIELDEQFCQMHPSAKCGPHVVVTVGDTGTGMEPHVIEKIFDPFFTTKEIGRGTGLGLSTVLGIVKSHGGWVTVYSEVGKGSQFKVYLPALVAQTSPPEPREKTELLVGHGELVLVVDDERAIREITRETLQANGYRVLMACDGTEAVEACARSGTDIDLVITDMVMPFMDGPATIRALSKMNPDLKIIAVSGMADNAKAAEVAGGANLTFLSKPFTAEKLLAQMRKVLAPP